MRLILIEDQKEIKEGMQLLQAHGIACNERDDGIAVLDEDHFIEAQELLKNPVKALPQAKSDTPKKKAFSKHKWVIKRSKFLANGQAGGFIMLIIFLCGALFMLTTFEEEKVKKDKGALAFEVGLTPTMRKLVFDFPAASQDMLDAINEFPVETREAIKELPKDQQSYYELVKETPVWRGIAPRILGHEDAKVPMFEKIKIGQYWRLITPVFLHANFLHILFNMMWLIHVGRMLEERLGIFRLALLMLLVGVISNVSQYLVSGPYFIGYSGIVCGLVGFIFVRQKKAAWEGYPLQRSTFLFLSIFVFAVAALSVVSFVLDFYTNVSFVPMIANTAHIAGGLAGAGLALLPIFSMRRDL